MRVAVPVLALLLAACGSAPDSEAADEPLTAPAMSIAPEAISYQDIETNNLYGASCAYASGKSMAPVVIAFLDEAVMKVGGQIRRFKLDPQCTEVRVGTGSRYLADGQVIDLAIEGEGEHAGYEAVNYTGSVKLSTADGQVLYKTSGAVQCGS